MNLERNIKIALATNAGGGQLDVCLSRPEFRNSICVVITDSRNKNLKVAGRFGVPATVLTGETGREFNDKLLHFASESELDAIISFGFTRLFGKRFLDEFSGKVYNSHFSLLPAFPGKRNSDWTTEHLGPRMIFERALLYGVRMIGNTIHQVDASIDGGTPVIQSCLPVPYEFEEKALRHRLFVQECQCLFQFVEWLKEGRVMHEGSRISVKDASFEQLDFSPSLEESWIRDFSPDLK